MSARTLIFDIFLKLLFLFLPILYFWIFLMEWVWGICISHIFNCFFVDSFFCTYDRLFLMLWLWFGNGLFSFILGCICFTIGPPTRVLLQYFVNLSVVFLDLGNRGLANNECLTIINQEIYPLLMHECFSINLIIEFYELCLGFLLQVGLRQLERFHQLRLEGILQRVYCIKLFHNYNFLNVITSAYLLH